MGDTVCAPSCTQPQGHARGLPGKHTYSTEANDAGVAGPVKNHDDAMRCQPGVQFCHTEPGQSLIEEGAAASERKKKTKSTAKQKSSGQDAAKGKQ